MTYHPTTNRARKTYFHPEKLIQLYKYLETEFHKNQRYPSNMELVKAGFGASTSVIRFYYDHMERLKMLHRDYNIARGIRLLPLTHAAEEIKAILAMEPQ